jgi:hypothetical protein
MAFLLILRNEVQFKTFRHLESPPSEVDVRPAGVLDFTITSTGAQKELEQFKLLLGSSSEQSRQLLREYAVTAFWVYLILSVFSRGALSPNRLKQLLT